MSDIKKLMAAHHEKLLLETAECRKRTKELERENAALREDKERLDWLERFLQLGGASVFSSPTCEAHKDLPDDTEETRWNHPFHIGYDVEIEHRGCYKWRELANGSKGIRSAIDAARAALRKEAQP